MFLNYPELIQFSNGLTYGNMFEALVTKSVYDWVEAIADRIDASYRFTATYTYNQFGVAVEANIRVQRNINGKWKDLGTYSSSIPLTCPDILLVDDDNGGGNIPSQSIHYYVKDYYEPGYYV